MQKEEMEKQRGLVAAKSVVQARATKTVQRDQNHGGFLKKAPKKATNLARKDAPASQHSLIDDARNRM